MFKSLRFKLLSIFLSIFGVFLCVLAGFFYEGLRTTYATEFDRSLYNHIIDVSASIDFTYLGQLIVQKDPLTEEKKVFPFSLGQSLMQIRDMNGRLLLSSRKIATYPLPFDKSRIDELNKHGYYFETLPRSSWPSGIGLKGEYRLLQFLVKKDNFPSLVIQMAAPLTSLNTEIRYARDSLTLMVISVLLLAALLSWWMSRGLLRPIDQMIATAHNLQATDLKGRVPVPRESELRNLAKAFNDLLNRLETAFKSQERFVADASHQIKTPLAILRGEMDVMIKKPRTAEEWNRFAFSASQEVATLSKLVEDLLLLAQVDAGGNRFPLTSVPLDEAVFLAMRRLGSKAQEKKVKLDFQFAEDNYESFLVNGHLELLNMLFYNLIENAIKYSPEGSVVLIQMKTTPDSFIVIVSDQGPGLQPEEVTRIFDRFYRAPHQSPTEGHGLGLAIAHHLAEIHKASIKVESEPSQGTRFIVEIKKL